MDEESLHADSLERRPATKIQQKHWITGTPMDAELTIGGTAVPGLAERSDHGDAVAGAARDAVLQRRAAAQPRPVPHGLRRRPDRRRGSADLLAQHGDPGRRRGQLRPPRHRAAAALHRRQRGDDVRPARHQRHAGRAAGRDAGDRPVAAVRQEHRPLLDLPRDVRAGVGQPRHGVAGRPPAARRAAGHRPRRAGGRAAAAVERADRGPGHPRSATARSTSPPRATGDRYRTTVDDRRPLRRLRIGHTLPRGAEVRSVRLDGGAVPTGMRARPTAASRSRSRPGAATTPWWSRRARRAVGRALAGARPTRSRAPSGRRPSTPARGWRARPVRAPRRR